MTPLDAVARPARAAMSWRWPLPVALALRELRAGLGGFYVFIGCVALGVAVIAGVGALSDGLRAGFESQGRRILGGDVTLARVHKRAEPAERAWLAGQGRLSESATLRSMARTEDGNEQLLVELKAVDAPYPLVGAVTLRDKIPLDVIRSEPAVAVEPIVLERLAVNVGDIIRVGTLPVRIAAVVTSEPDGISDRNTFGPRLLMSLETLDRTGLVQPGTLVRWRYALDVGTASDARLDEFRKTLSAALPEAGFVIADRRDPSPRVTQTLDRLRQFLTLIGLTALLVGGVGVANAVATFIDKRRKVIATMKSLGAANRTVFAVFLAQVLLIAGIGVVAGLFLGNLVPIVLDRLYGEALPIRAEIRVAPATVLSAAVYGLLVALVFTLWPLGRAELVRPGVLFREEVAGERRWPRPLVLAALGAAILVLLAFAVLMSDQRRLALFFCLGMAAVIALFFGLGYGVTALVRRLPRPRSPELALALGNIGGPGGLTRSVVLSLGVGLSLLVTVALANSSIVGELTTRISTQSPNYFVLDIARADETTFRDTVRRIAPDALIQEAPMIRGRIVRLNGRPVEEVKPPAEAQWVLNGDRGLTYAETVPEGSKVVAGSWWPADVTGEPQVSFEAELAKNLGLSVGDTVTVNVLGRNVTARITSLREVKWESLAINFVMVFSPNTLKSAPHNLLATVTLPTSTSLADEARIGREIGRTLPSVTAIRVKDALDQFNAVFQKVMVAIQAAGGVTLAAGALVLAGALATAQRRRIQQAVILKVVGATRGRILLAHAFEYGLLAVVTAAMSVVIGALAAWLVVVQVMKLDFVFSMWAIVQALSVALGLVLLFGSVGTWQVLRAPAVPFLRSE